MFYVPYIPKGVTRSVYVAQHIENIHTTRFSLFLYFISLFLEHQIGLFQPSSPSHLFFFASAFTSTFSGECITCSQLLSEHSSFENNFTNEKQTSVCDIKELAKTYNSISSISLSILWLFPKVYVTFQVFCSVSLIYVFIGESSLGSSLSNKHQQYVSCVWENNKTTVTVFYCSLDFPR
jgi:hypothetical protein